MQTLTVQNPALARAQQLIAFLTLSVPLLGAVGAACWAVVRGVSSASLTVFAVLYLLTAAGVTVGFHRLFTHRSFKPVAPVRVALAVLGMMSAQGSLIFWVACHRRHHAFSDTQDDCHSPCMHGSHFAGRLRGFWHAHMGWMLRAQVTNVFRFAKDISKDPVLVRLSRYYLLWVLLGLAVPGMIGAISPGGWGGAIEGLLWGGALRIFCVHQITWGVNSLTHVVGSRRYAGDDNSRNLSWLAWVTLGEGWHNNHHASPGSAKLGHEWWELDLGYGVIRALQLCRLCTDVKCPDSNVLRPKRIALQSDQRRKGTRLQTTK